MDTEFPCTIIQSIKAGYFDFVVWSYYAVLTLMVLWVEIPYVHRI